MPETLIELLDGLAAKYVRKDNEKHGKAASRIYERMVGVAMAINAVSREEEDVDILVARSVKDARKSAKKAEKG